MNDDSSLVNINAPGGKVLVIKGNVANLTMIDGRTETRLFVGVPRRPDTFVGRDELVAQLRSRLRNGGVLALEGQPGVGKTTLATTLAWDAEVLAHFSGGVFWASLGPSPNVDELLNRWAEPLDIDVTQEPQTEQRAARIQAKLAGRSFLFVLDDVWQEPHADLFCRITAPGCVHLLTTRDQTIASHLASGNSERIKELPEEQAVALLAALYPIAQADEEALRRLACAAGGLPLALSLIGGYLADHITFRAEAPGVFQALSDAEAWLGLKDKERRLNLSEVIDLSIDALPDDAARQVFARLAAFAPKPASFSLEAAQAVSEGNLAVLGTLVRRNLLEKMTEDRVTIHPVIVACAEQRARRNGWFTDLQAQHGGHYLDWVNHDPAWQLIEAEWPQIQQASDWAARSPGQDRRVLQLVGALQVFMERRGLRAQQRAWLERAVEAARSLGDRAEEGRLLGSLGLCWWQLGQHRKAIDCLEHALTFARQTRDRQAEGRHLGSLGLVWATAMFRDQAIGYYEEALAIARELDDRQGEGSHLGALGLAWVEEGVAKLALGETTKDSAAPYFREAIKYYKQALVVARAVDDRRAEGSHLGNLGDAWLLLGDAAQAKDFLSQALAILREIEDRPNEAFHLANLGRAQQALGDVQAAKQGWQDALAIYDAYSDPRAATLRTWLKKIEGDPQ